MYKAQIFDQKVPADVAGMVAAVKAAGGCREGGHESYMVRFDDGSFWSAAVFYPEGREPYFNGGALLGGATLAAMCLPGAVR